MSPQMQWQDSVLFFRFLYGLAWRYGTAVLMDHGLVDQVHGVEINYCMV